MKEGRDGGRWEGEVGRKRGRRMKYSSSRSVMAMLIINMIDREVTESRPLGMAVGDYLIYVN